MIVELHVLQRIIGCELEKLSDGSVNLTPVDEFRFDGEDCVVDTSTNAKETKIKWDSQIKLQAFINTCLDWISTFNNTKNSKF